MCPLGLLHLIFVLFLLAVTSVHFLQCVRGRGLADVTLSLSMNESLSQMNFFKRFYFDLFILNGEWASEPMQVERKGEGGRGTSRVLAEPGDWDQSLGWISRTEIMTPPEIKSQDAFPPEPPRRLSNEFFLVCKLWDHFLVFDAVYHSVLEILPPEHYCYQNDQQKMQLRFD